MITSSAANMASIAIECTLFGIFMILSSTSLVLLVRRRALHSGTPLSSFTLTSSNGSRCSISKFMVMTLEMAKTPLIVANVLLMLTVSAHWVLGIQRLFMAVVYLNGGDAAIDYFNNLQVNTEVARTALLFVDMLTGDAVITYRMWLVWSRKSSVLIFPAITISALIVFGVGLLHEFGNSSHSVFQTAVVRWILGYCAATIFTNLYGTLMIAYRIWSTNRVLKRSNVMAGNRQDLTSALAIFVESAALYSAWAIMFVIFYGLKSTLQSIGSGCGPTIIGIAFMLITVRVGLGWGQESKAITTDRPSVRFPPGRFVGSPPAEESSYPMTTFTLNVTQTVEQETDYGLAQGDVKRPEGAVLT